MGLVAASVVGLLRSMLISQTAMHISTPGVGLMVTTIASPMILNGLRIAWPVLAAHG